ncbi:(2Fe-2S) binding domain protein [Verrucomicrobiia bacterium DG1235]|nr:(2Fe-2S) binding domain protein [Verrucomicrobiae bacterium DG1235]
MRYRPMTSCLLPMGELHGKHLVSIEGLNMEQLSPVQSAMVECGGTQCGYCTPGFIVAMTAGLMDETIPLSEKGHDFATSGNLCRCTGYRSIKQAGQQAFRTLEPDLSGRKSRIKALCSAKALPKHFLDAAEKLCCIPQRKQILPPDSEYTGPIVAGGTDLFVQKGEEIPDTFPQLLNQKAISPALESDGVIRIDARSSFEAFARDPVIQEAIPNILKYNDLIASWPIRTRASLGGNICNASPIADMTCLLLALEAELVIFGDSGKRIVPLQNFYLGYKTLAKKGDELIAEIRFPKPKRNERINWSKVSKRKILDIASVNSAAKIEAEGETIKQAIISLGGVAATPLALNQTSRFLQGASLSSSTILEALSVAQNEISPISDVRGSAIYKRLLARQLIAQHFVNLFPDTISEEAVCEALR